ncbi:GNAT family N-acetyltransferase [Marinifilum flexuosum]|uniref:GNAT family N-acetyltransferase n=1 Tax=Marinifilum flexuosum TaxID=1117708 RepID=UPI00249582A1|nr:GNAT family N-acetyltransferase [Marinifilum flexuosum]
MKLYLKNRKNLSSFEIQKIVELLSSIWPPIEESIDINQMIQTYSTTPLYSFHKVLLYFKDEELIGHTEVFNREVFVGTNKMEILALAGVCVKLEFRGKDIGFSMVENAFRFVDNGKFKCSIFQTNVPGFYERIECKQIQNRFVNRKSKTDVNKNPWRDPFVMLYPESLNLGLSEIDLNGECY